MVSEGSLRRDILVGAKGSGRRSVLCVDSNVLIGPRKDVGSARYMVER